MQSVRYQFQAQFHVVTQRRLSGIVVNVLALGPNGRLVRCKNLGMLFNYLIITVVWRTDRQSTLCIITSTMTPKYWVQYSEVPDGCHLWSVNCLFQVFTAARLEAVLFLSTDQQSAWDSLSDDLRYPAVHSEHLMTKLFTGHYGASVLLLLTYL